MNSWIACLLAAGGCLAMAASSASAAPEAIPLWPGAAPGDKGDIGEERGAAPPAPRVPAKKIRGPAEPCFAPGHYGLPPGPGQRYGAAVVVCPGGGYQILAMNLEGTEVCKWLNSIGVTAVLLKYRAPAHTGLPRHVPPLQDAQRALGIVRRRAGEWGIDPKRIGILGFSAGGHLSTALSTNYDARTYPPVDEVDRESCRPDFTVLIYPAYLIDEKDPSRLSPETRVNEKTPPAFLTMTMDDPIGVGNVFTYARALKEAGVPAELHGYPTDGHGYGLRPSPNAVSQWP